MGRGNARQVAAWQAWWDRFWHVEAGLGKAGTAC
jgi:hypothetical protein